jgi:hypothetical protein
MNRYMSFILFFILALYGCIDGNDNKKVYFKVPFKDSICDFQYYNNNSSSSRLNRNNQTLKDIIYNMENSTVSIIKFGSPKRIVFYDCDGVELFKVNYNGNKFKYKGVVYEAPSNLE